MQKLSQITKQQKLWKLLGMGGGVSAFFFNRSFQFKWMFLNISLGIAHSHLLEATGLQDQTMFSITCWDPELSPQAAPSFPKAILWVSYRKCSQPRCCTHKTQNSISKWQFWSFKPTFVTTPKCNEEHKHSPVNLYMQKGYSQWQANNHEEAPVVLS